ncbi:MAG TPA: alpha/beta hydrolase [Polyangiaceae bacterium]|nr:alpha/beta hydrolase [Polyangiaceae bacterium]
MSSVSKVPVGSALLAVESEGSGPVLVCLHAGVCDRRMWRPLAQRLRSEYRVVAYDRRGFGESTSEDEVHSDVDDLLAVIDGCAGSAPVILVGASRGGALAIDLALARPERVSALVLMASAVSGDPDDAPVPDAIQKKVDALAAAERSGDVDAVNALEVQVWLDGPLEREGRVGGALRELVLDMNGIALRHPALSQKLEPPPAFPRLEALMQPALVLWGDLDFPDRVALSESLAARLPHAHAHVVQGTAHLPSLERPEECASVLRAFLAEALNRS